MRYVIQYYAPAVQAAPDFRSLDFDCLDLSEAEARAQRNVAPGGAYHWAEAYEVMDYDSFSKGKIDDPAVASWRRHVRESSARGAGKLNSSRRKTAFR